MDHPGAQETGILKRQALDAAGKPVRALSWGDIRSQLRTSVAPDADAVQAKQAETPRSRDEAGERMVRVCRSLAAALAREREALLRALQPRLVELALELARRIVQHEASVDPALIERTVAAAMAGAPQAVNIVVRVAPADVDAVARVRDEGSPAMRIVGDDSISPGGCMLETEWGDIDATIETQLVRLAEALLAQPREIA